MKAKNEQATYFHLNFTIAHWCGMVVSSKFRYEGMLYLRPSFEISLLQMNLL